MGRRAKNKVHNAAQPDTGPGGANRARRAPAIMCAEFIVGLDIILGRKRNDHKGRYFITEPFTKVSGAFHRLWDITGEERRELGLQDLRFRMENAR